MWKRKEDNCLEQMTAVVKRVTIISIIKLWLRCRGSFRADSSEDATLDERWEYLALVGVYCQPTSAE